MVTFLLSAAAMAPSVDCCAASLLCCEESVCLSDEGEQEIEECRFSVLHCESSPSWLALELQETSDAEAAIYALAEREIFHQPRSDYTEKYQSKLLDAGFREQAISWLFKVADQNFSLLFGNVVLFALQDLRIVHYQLVCSCPCEMWFFRVVHLGREV